MRITTTQLSRANRLIRRILPFLAVSTARLTVLLAVVFLLLGLLGEKFWVFDNLAAFRGQYCAALIGSGAALLLLRRWISGAVGLAAGIAVACTLLPSGNPPRTPTAHSAGLKLISFNVLKTNPNREEIARYLEAEAPDVVFLAEMTTPWAEDLEKLRAVFPHQISSSREKKHGIVLLSKHPFTSQSVQFIDKRPSIEAAIVKDGVPYHIAGVHAVVPWDMECAAARNEQLLTIAGRIAGRPHLVFCGDFNMTPYSPWFPKILATGKLHDTARLSGFSPSWMRGTIVFAVPIDQVLLGGDLEVVSRQIGPALGSDHNPVIVEMVPLAPPAVLSAR